MDFYDSLFQYDLEIQNKLTERLNSFIKSISLLKNESIINQPNNKDPKYKQINILIDEINTSNIFKTKLILNQKRQLLLRMNNKNKNKINSKYYIYAKDMNKDNQKIDIIQIDNTLLKKELNKEQNFTKIQKNLELDKFFNQKKIYFEKSKEKDKNNLSDEENNLNKLKLDINKIVCDIIKQNVKNIYNKKLNDIFLKSHKNTINNNDNNTINLNIKNNNYIKNDMPQKDLNFKETKEEKEIKKIHNNHSSEKNGNYMQFFNDNKKNSMKKELRNSVTNNNGNHLKIKSNKNDILSFNNLNKNNINNLLIINNKIKSAKNTINSNINIIRNNNIIENKRVQENENKSNPKKVLDKDNEKIINNKNKNKIKNKNKQNNKNNREKNNNDSNNKDSNNNGNKNDEQSHKKTIIRNIQRIQIKNIKLKNNPTGYNLTNICKKKLENFDFSEKNNLKKSKQKERQCASPDDNIVTSKKINIIKFNLGKNDPTTVRKETERSFKKNNEGENINENENTIISLVDEKAKDIYSQGIRFSSVKKSKNKDDMSCNDISHIFRSKNINNNNFFIKNYKTNIKRNNNNNNKLKDKNSFTKDSEADFYLLINRKNNFRKSLSKESISQSYLNWNISKLNKSNNKGNMVESYLNQLLQIDKKNNCQNALNNINEYKNIKNNDKHYIYNEKILPNKNINKNYAVEQKCEGGQINDKKIQNKNKSIYNKKNNNFKENKQLAEAGYNDTINNKDEPISYRGDVKIKGKRRILSTRVHIRGVNGPKNYKNIL